jgi:hypothetical protein
VTGGSLQKTLDVVIGFYLFATDGKNAVAVMYVEAGLGKWRLFVRVPATADQNLRDTVVAILDRVVSAEPLPRRC